MPRIFLLLLCALPLCSSSQERKEDLIYWKEELRLKWDDYKGEPGPGADAAASTATYLGIEYNFDSNNKLGYKITCSFSKTKSWVRNPSDHILSHEQGHFDIAEIFARKLNKQMKFYTFNPATYQADLKKIYVSILEEKETMQNGYDFETNHSINKEKQAEWLKKINVLLKEYNAFSNYSGE